MPTLRKTYRGANEIRYAEPDAFQNTVTQSVRTQPKKAGSRTVYNVNGALNAQRTVTLPPLPNGTTTDQERLALRFSISGSTASKAAVAAMLADFRAWLIAIEDDMTSGFLSEADLSIANPVAKP